MVPATLRRLGTLGLIALWVLVSGGLLLLLAFAVKNSVQYSKLQEWILLINAIAVVVVSVLLARKIYELVRAFRAQVPGSRLTARTVAIFGSLVVAPLIIVYLFSLEFLNRGIDSWFKVEVKQGLTDALQLSKDAMNVRMREYARNTQLFAVKLSLSPTSEWGEAAEEQRVTSGALEIVVYGPLGPMVVSSGLNPSAVNPTRYAREQVDAAIAGGNSFWSLEPLSEGDYLINTAAPIAAPPGSREGRFVVALYPVPPHLARLSDAVLRSNSQYAELTAQREGVKNLFGLTLTLVLLLAMLTAIYGAIHSAEKLTRPVQDLIAGTRAVGKGDFGTRLPLPSRDEMGFLVHSFNDMTKRLRRALQGGTGVQLQQLAVESDVAGLLREGIADTADSLGDIGVAMRLSPIHNVLVCAG
jgi:nitrogen fixation/metabolism regulation signal transduction histidine kinase